MASDHPSGAVWYRRIWRWHFYAGLFVAPFLVMLSITGGIYLFERELNDLIYPELRFAAARGEAMLAPGAVLERAAAAFPGSTPLRIAMPAEAGRSTEVQLALPGGTRQVFVDPWDGRVLGSFVYAQTLVGIADRLHGSLMIGTLGDRLIELAACWTIVLIGTGIFLWWPRRDFRMAGTFALRAGSAGRRFWRDLHAVTGIYVAALVLFLLVTGLPWTGFWGESVKNALNGAGLGYPAALFQAVPRSAVPTDAGSHDIPWALGGTPMPASDPHAGHHGGGAHGREAIAGHPTPIGVDAVAAIARTHGIPDGYRLVLPRGRTGVYSVRYWPRQPEAHATLHIDQYSGRVLADARFADYALPARAIDIGVALHMGTYFGRLNQLLMLSACIGVLVLTASGVVMWWKRRPRGRIGAPPAVPGMRWARVAPALILLGLLFPLLGASLVPILALEYLVLRRAAGPRRGIG